MARRIDTLTATEYLKPRVEIAHLNLSALDTFPEIIFENSKNSSLESLDLSRLQLDDNVIEAFARSSQFQKLWWLDLAANNITLRGVEAICCAVRDGRLPNLLWLELLGTRCDATPYIDGQYWRMTDIAKALARTYGYQKWMMLGSRTPDKAHCELLSVEERRVPPRRF